MARPGIGSYDGQWARPDDAQREKEEAERIEGLTAHSVLLAEQDADERNIMAPALGALEEKLGELGGQALDPSPMDQALAGIKARAQAAVEEAALTAEQRQAQAIADALAERGFTATAPTPEVRPSDAPADEESPLGEPGLYSDEQGRTWHLDAAGDWNRLDEDEAEEVEEAEAEYDPLGDWEAEVDERQKQADDA